MGGAPPSPVGRVWVGAEPRERSVTHTLPTGGGAPLVTHERSGEWGHVG